MSLQERIDKFEDEFLKFDRVENKKSTRSDIHAFILLNELCPATSDIVAAAEHDEIFLGVEVEELDLKATDEQLLELVRCGLRYDSYTDSLAMFV